jgi:hypothetical protein
MSTARITVTLPPELLDEIDRRERNRSRFVLEAVRREVQRRRKEELRRSLAHPHVETSELADAGFEDWGSRTRSGESAGVLDAAAGRPIRWVRGKGWIETKR